MKYMFYNDYSEGAHPRILEALMKTNLVQENGYGEDEYSMEAAKLIRSAIAKPGAAVHLVSGGTQANLLVLGALLKPYQSVIATTSAHIAVHEAGAIEATGHKINTVESKDGKITPQQIREVVAAHADEHMVQPRVVFISQSTEVGTIYSKKELTDISAVCKELNLLLYVDGARLASALTSVRSDIDIVELAGLVDVFYIGGTKNGALLGEAIIIVNPDLQSDFRYHLKQHGALLSKGRTIGVQFGELFRDGLYLELGRHANIMAQKLADGLRASGFAFLTDPATNQIFPILPNGLIERLKADYGFHLWQKIDDSQTAIRLVTSWATGEEAVAGLLEEMRRIQK